MTRMQLMQALVEDVLADREDRKILTPVVLAMVRGAVADFERYYDARHASNRVRDFDILMARNKAVKQARTSARALESA